jgi:hypothetical protein
MVIIPNPKVSAGARNIDFNFIFLIYCFLLLRLFGVAAFLKMVIGLHESLLPVVNDCHEGSK